MPFTCTHRSFLVLIYLVHTLHARSQVSQRESGESQMCIKTLKMHACSQSETIIKFLHACLQSTALVTTLAPRIS